MLESGVIAHREWGIGDSVRKTDDSAHHCIVFGENSYLCVDTDNTEAMERTDELFPAYTGRDKELVAAAYDIAAKALAGETRGNGAPFIEHAEKVAKIASDEIGLGAQICSSVRLCQLWIDACRLLLEVFSHQR